MLLMVTSKRPSKAARGSSGEHPAVIEFQKQLAQAGKDGGDRLDAINRELAEYLADIRTPVPPPLVDEDEGPPTKR
jgi:hypothetical protein